jgi:hypothetical protein
MEAPRVPDLQGFRGDAVSEGRHDTYAHACSSTEPVHVELRHRRPVVFATVARRHGGRTRRIVLLAAEGVPGKQIAAMVGCAEPTMVTGRGRYAHRGLPELQDLPRTGNRLKQPLAHWIQDARWDVRQPRSTTHGA